MRGLYGIMRRVITPHAHAADCGAGRLAARSPAEAIAAMIARLSPVETEVIRWSSALGRVPLELTADRPSPPSDVSAMDGYALRLADAAPGQAVKVCSFVLPGQPAPALEPGCAMRIMTGAVAPQEAELVIRREDVEESAESIIIKRGVKLTPGQNIRRRGENLAADGAILRAGKAISPATLASIVSFGHAELRVHRKLKARVIITGDELLDVEARPEPWQIRDSNGPALAALLGGCAWIDLLSVQRVRDDLESLRAAVQAALEDCDALLLTGGVSMGTHDFVPDAVRSCGGDVVFHRLPFRPGGPLLGAVGPRGQAIFGLPGNPMSVLATGRRIALPVLAHQAGMKQTDGPRPTVRVTNHDGKTLHLWWYRPVKLTAHGAAELVNSRGSGDMVSAAFSDGFVEIPPEQSGEGPWPFFAWSDEP